MLILNYYRKCCHSNYREQPPPSSNQAQTVIINWEANGVEKSETIHANGINGYSKNV
jgi:hypothetical protein